MVTTVNPSVTRRESGERKVFAGPRVRHLRLSLGLSTRGALALVKAARITAGLRGGDFVTPDDVKAASVWVMAHRLVVTPEAALEGSTDIEIVRKLLAETPVPR